MVLKIRLRPQQGEDPNDAIDKCVEFIRGKTSGLIEINRLQQTIEVFGAAHGLYHEAVSNGFNVEEV